MENESSKSFNLEYINCNLCGSREFSPHLKSPAVGKDKPSFSITSQAVSGEQIVRCKDCGLIYVNPRPPSKVILEEYSQGEGETYIKDARARAASFRRSLGVVKNYKKSGTILDVGCAAGLFLKVAEDEGFKVYGAEPNRWLAAWGKESLSLDISPKPFEEADFPREFFDIVTFWDVLEHLADPFSALQKTNQIMKEEGIVVLSYPDISSFLARAFGRNWWFVTSGHLFYFTSDTISKMLERAGFKVIRNRSYFQTLSLPYLLSRLGRYNTGLANSLSKFSEFLGLKNLFIPYYAGQRVVIARKISI